MDNFKKIEKFLLCACAYTIGITFSFFIIASMFKVDVALDLFSFFICFVIGVCIALANLIFAIDPLKIWFKIPLHYLALLIVYIPFVYTAIPSFMERSGALFVAIVIYTIFYAIVFAIAAAIKVLVRYLDDKAEKLGKKKNKKTAKADKPNYSPRFK